MRLLLFLLLAALSGIVPSIAQPAPQSGATANPALLPQSSPPEAPARPRTVADFISSLHFEKGDIPIGNGLAILKVPEAFRFLGAKDAEAVIVDLWGNPPGETPLGMLLPADLSPADKDSWAVVITYEEDGYVKDDDAAKVNYDKLLREMKKNTAKGSAERVKQGYEAIELVGWAAPPRYDSAAKKLYWAKELKFGDSPEHTLNYDIRVLGRRGVLSLNCVAGMTQLHEIEQKSPHILAMVNFSDGHRYADFDPKSDKLAAYGIAALVAGGIAAKTGLLKVIIGALIAGKKFIIIGVIAVIAFFRKLITGKKE